MMRPLLLPTILALVVGVAGSAGYAVMHARTEHAEQVATLDRITKARVDSLRADSARADSAAALAAHADSMLRTPADSIRALLLAHEAAVTPKAVVAARTAGTGPDESATTAPEAAVTAPPPADDLRAAAAAANKALAESANEPIPDKRLARIFSAMSPRDAAKVLEQMTDADVRTILALMGERQAAAVLAAFPAARAAAITAARPAAPSASGSVTP